MFALFRIQKSAQTNAGKSRYWTAMEEVENGDVIWISHSKYICVKNYCMYQSRKNIK
jgi:hypothetical protein